MMHRVLKRNVLATIVAVVVAVLTLAPASMARRHYRVYHGHYYVYHHHSKLKGALVGAAGGALVGGLVGHGKGALIGGAAGAGTGYLVQRYRNHRERRRLARYR